MEYRYKTEATCSKEIIFNIEGNIIRNIKFQNGCDGNLKAIPILLEGKSVEEIEESCGGIMCGRRPTSCTDQLAKAVRQAYDELGNKQIG